MWIELYIRIGVNAETIVWRVRSPLCAQVYFREQRVPESFTRTALLLSLRWGADGRVGQPEGRRHWWVSSFSTYCMLFLHNSAELRFFRSTPIVSIIRGLCIFWYVSSIRVSGDPLSKLPVPHKLAILATMDEVSVILLNVSSNTFTSLYTYTQYTLSQFG